MEKAIKPVSSSEIFDFLNREPVTVAQALLGCHLYIITADGQKIGGIICETEAYLAKGDLAAHNARGHTNANKSLFADAGTLYIHQMRQHILMDIVTEGHGIPGSVLIRAIEPTDGIEIMKERRGVNDLQKLCAGPGNVCKALSIDRSFDGMNILSANSTVQLDISCNPLSAADVTTTTRVGISSNAEAPLRFYLTGSAFYSSKNKR